MADPGVDPILTSPQVGDRIWADRYDEEDWFGPGSDPIALFPPFVDATTYRRYQGNADPIDGLALAVEWRIVGWPKRNPRIWLQMFIDGVETMSETDITPAVRIEAAYDDFCRFQIGERRLRDFRLGSIVDGSLGGLSSLAYLVEQPSSLRGALMSPMTHQLVSSEVFDAWINLH